MSKKKLQASKNKNPILFDVAIEEIGEIYIENGRLFVTKTQEKRELEWEKLIKKINQEKIHAPSLICSVCSLDLSKITGYVCNNFSCPTRISCTF